MIASYQSKQARMNDRLKLPAQVRIGEDTYEAKDWSFAGMSIHNKPGAVFVVDAVVDLTLQLPMEHYTAQCHLQGTVRRVDEESVGFEFVNPPHGVRLLMRHYVRNYVEGRLETEVPAFEGIDHNQSMPENRGNEFSDPASLKAHKSFRKRFIQYAVLCMLLIATVVLVFTSQRYVHSIQAGLIGNTVEIRSLLDGNLKTIHVKTGDDIKLGAALFDLDDTEALRDVQAGYFLQKRLQKAIESAQSMVHEQNKRDNLYSRVANARKKMDQSRVDETNVLLQQTNTELGRIEKLREAGYVSEAYADERRFLLKQRQAQLQRAQSEVHLATDIAEEAKQGRFFSTNEVTNKRGEALAALEKYNADLANAIVLFGPVLTRYEQMHIKSPASGKVRIVTRNRGEVIRIGELIAVIETEDPVSLVARFEFNDSARLVPGMRARVLFPGIDKVIYGKVEAVGPQGMPNGRGLSNISPEAGVVEVPVSFTLDDPSLKLPSGVRAKIEVDTGHDFWTLLKQRLL